MACFIISVSVVPIIGCVENRRWGDRALPYSGPSRTRRNHTLPDVTIVYWRDIPAQVIVGKGRRGAKRQLPERFEQAIDRAAMKVNAKDSDGIVTLTSDDPSASANTMNEQFLSDYRTVVKQLQDEEDLGDMDPEFDDEDYAHLESIGFEAIVDTTEAAKAERKLKAKEFIKRVRADCESKSQAIKLVCKKIKGKT